MTEREHKENEIPGLDPAVKFPYGYDVNVYLDKALDLLKESYPWVTEKHLNRRYSFAIEQENGEYEFIEYYKEKKGKRSREVLKGYMEDMNGEQFIHHVVFCHESHVVYSNEVVDTYNVPFGHVDLNGWNLERYVFEKRATGDYTVSVTAGDRSAGAGRTFGISAKCFAQPTFEGFLDEYEKIVPGDDFGLYKEDLIGDARLKEFLGY